MKKVIIGASCKNSVEAGFERNQITTVGQDFSIAQYKAVLKDCPTFCRSRIVLAVLLMAVFLLLPIQSFAATKVFEREYTYQASEADSKLSFTNIDCNFVPEKPKYWKKSGDQVNVYLKIDP